MTQEERQNIIKTLYSTENSEILKELIKKYKNILSEKDIRLLEVLSNKCVKYDYDLNFWLKPIINLNFLEYVGGYLCLQNTPIKQLENLNYVGTTLNLYKTEIDNLKNLKYVGKDLDLNYTPITQLENLNHVGGNLYLDFTGITSLKNLMHIGGNLDLRSTHLENFGNLKYIGGDLYLNNKIKKEDLPENLVVKGIIIEQKYKIL